VYDVSLTRPLEMAEFYAEPSKCREGVDYQSAPVAGVVISLVGIRSRLGSAADTDRVGDPIVLAPGVRLASLGARRGVAEGTANERLLHHSSSSSTSQAPV